MNFADRVKDSTDSTGIGPIVLSGTAPTRFQTFASAFGSAPVAVSYCIADQSGPNWEVGIGTFNGTTGLTRSAVLASSNAGGFVAFTAGTKDVFCTVPAAMLQPFTATQQGTVPASGGGTANFLRADGAWAATGGVTTFNTRSGAVTLTSADVTSALAFTPYSAANPAGYLTGITSGQVTTALGFTPYSSANPAGYISSVAPVGSTTEIPYNGGAGVYAASSLFSYASGTNTLSVGNITGSALAMTIQPKVPTALETGGLLTLSTPTAAKANTPAGSIIFSVGNGLGTGAGGGLLFRTGDGGALGVGGAFTVLLGQSYSGVGSSALFIAGNGATAGGDLNFNAGSASGVGASGGSVSFQAGDSGTGAGATGGGFYFSSGGSSSGTGGELVLAFGAGSVADGAIRLQDAAGNDVVVVSSVSGLPALSFFGAAPIKQLSAYTKTYSTASRTVPNAAFTNLVTTAATNIAPYGFTTQAQADAIATKVNQLAADNLILKQLIVSLINDSSTTMGVGLNAT
jgi:hypothetical protein